MYVCSLRYPACTVFLSKACPALHYFSTLLHKQHDFWWGEFEQKMFVSIFSTSFVWSIYHSRKKWTRCGLHIKYLLFMSNFNKNWIFSMDFQKILKFHENPSSGSRVVTRGQTDGHTDMTKLTVAFRTLANVPKKGEGLQSRPEETYFASMFLNLLWQSSYWLKPPLLSPSYSFDYPCSSHPAYVIKPHLHTYHISMKINPNSPTLKMVAAHSS